MFFHLVFFTDVVQLEAPRMSPDSAEHLEILEEFSPRASSSTLQRRTDTCSERQETLKNTLYDTNTLQNWAYTSALLTAHDTEKYIKTAHGEHIMRHIKKCAFQVVLQVMFCIFMIKWFIIRVISALTVYSINTAATATVQQNNIHYHYLKLTVSECLRERTVSVRWSEGLHTPTVTTSHSGSEQSPNNDTLKLFIR